MGLRHVKRGDPRALPESPEEGPYVVHEELGLFQRGEVAACLVLAPVLDPGVGIVEMGGRGACPREPVEGDVREEQIPVDGVLRERRRRVGPLLNFSMIQASCPTGESTRE
jgi:hypothetical protein